jgi:hypothetical protein
VGSGVDFAVGVDVSAGTGVGVGVNMGIGDITGIGSFSGISVAVGEVEGFAVTVVVGFACPFALFGAVRLLGLLGRVLFGDGEGKIDGGVTTMIGAAVDTITEGTTILSEDAFVISVACFAFSE